MLALATYGDTKNIVMSALEVKGPFDEAACLEAVARASAEFPQVMSCIRETRARGLHYLSWVHRPDIPLPMRVSEMPIDPKSGTVLDHLLDHLRPRLERQWNPFEEVPAWFQCIRVTDTHYVLASAFHHVASDAGTASEFGRRFLVHYHEITTGKQPDWVVGTSAISSSNKRKVKIRKMTLRESIAIARQTVDNLLEKPTLPAGSGTRGDLGEHHVKRVFSAELTERIGKSAVGNGVSFVDLLTACTNLAVDQWNESRNVQPGILTTSMTVNTRGRFSGSDKANNSSVIFFRFSPEERRDFKKFSRSLALARIKHFRNQMDLKYMRDIGRMMNSVRLLPFHLRRKIVHRVVDRHQFSVGVTLLGVLWPKIKNGKPTVETAFTECGDVVISEVHGIGYKLLSSTRVVLIVYAYNNRMNLVLASDACLFTRQEAEDFLELIVANLVEKSGVGD